MTAVAYQHPDTSCDLASADNDAVLVTVDVDELGDQVAPVVRCGVCGVMLDELYDDTTEAAAS